jgi:uncharacterized protein YbaR (Trm112 family)
VAEIDPRLLEVLVCPTCRGSVTLEGDALHCAHCRVAYPVRGGIPVMLADQALPLR